MRISVPGLSFAALSFAAPRRALDRFAFSPAGQAAAAALSGLAAGLVPVTCAACGAPDRSLCSSCAAKVRRVTIRPCFVQEGAAALPAAQAAESGQAAESAAFAPLPVLAAGTYRGDLARVLLAFKNRGHTDLAGFLVPVLAGVLQEAAREAYRLSGSRTLVLVPVPGSARSMRRRGYAPLALLIKRIERAGLLPPGCSAAPLVSYVRGYGSAMPFLPGRTGNPAADGRHLAQKGLGSGNRRRNVRNTMTAGRSRSSRGTGAAGEGSLAGVSCVVVDDVLTTGATIGETVRALRAEGAGVFCAAVMAATPAPARNTYPGFGAAAGAHPQEYGNGIGGRE